MTSLSHITLARRLRRISGALMRDKSGLAAVELAMASPLLLTLFLYGSEIANFTITKMRVSQAALHIADNASRIGTKQLLSNPRISELQINDLLIGAGLQAGSLDLFTRGRVIVSSVEPMANPNSTNRYKIHWQRCKGSKSWPSSYGKQGASNLTGVGVPGREVTAPDGGGVIYVEVAYDYRPLVSGTFAPAATIKEVAAMTVRDERDYDGNGGTGVYNTENAPVSSC